MAKYEGKRTRFSRDGISKSAEKTRNIIPGEKIRAGLGSFFHGLRDRFALRDSVAQKLSGLKKIKDRIMLTRVTLPVPGKGGKFAMPASSISDMADRAVGMAVSLFNKIRRSRAALIGIAAGIVIAFIIILIDDFTRVRSLSGFHPGATTKIYDKNGVIISEIFSQKRDVVPLKKIPRNLINAFIAIEDNEFYEHWGVNPKGIVRAFFINLFSGRIRQGGSTITQQLAKILLTTRERSLYRKIKDAIIAVMIEFTYSKDEIMSLYLNQLFLGHGTWGIEAAARYYFDRHVWELGLGECSLLASLTSAPNQYSPLSIAAE